MHGCVLCMYVCGCEFKNIVKWSHFIFLYLLLLFSLSPIRFQCKAFGNDKEVKVFQGPNKLPCVH